MKKEYKGYILLLVALLLPLALLGLFFGLRGNEAAMNVWVFQVLWPAAGTLGRIWSVLPFSVGELMTTCFLLWAVVFLIRAVVLVVRRRVWPLFFRRLGTLVAAFLWVGAALCWMWNAAYYVPDFTQRSGVELSPYTVEELRAVTEYFAQQAAYYSLQVERDEEGYFLPRRQEDFRLGPGCYQAVEEEFPFLRMEAVRAKPLLCSRLQSALGFTGVYFPLTGEANVNIHFPSALLPATIAHEMAHQRMVASEMEANFLAVLASTAYDDVGYRYSGYYLGLIQLCNALYPEDPVGWVEIVEEYFTVELSTDWNENSAYWKARESNVEQVAEELYDGYLKGNEQELGIQSYGACVDLLVAYFLPKI